eukprot:m.76929 g.76929  ORF g.76929 m.76929 type:complete len:241 (-) comp12591_c0_seq1:1825-2547(-)
MADSSYKTMCLVYEEDDEVKHYIFYKLHTSRKIRTDLPTNKTLFVLNPPLDPEHTLQKVFSEAGAIDNVIPTTVGSQNKLVKAAYVVFKKVASAKKAMNFEEGKQSTLPKVRKGKFGLEKWLSQARAERPDPEELQKTIDADLNQFDNEKEKEKALRLAKHGQEDEEGWTMVTRGGKHELETGGTSVAKKRPKKERELQNFYRFQMKEARKEQIAVLRRKFDLDKQRVAQMKGERKFRPY